MSEKHSPGPWRWEQCRGIGIGSDPFVYLSDARANTIVTEDPAEPASDADKRLIAAAPEMLGLLNKARHIGSIGYCPWCSEWNGHFTSCELVALLARIDGELTP